MMFKFGIASLSIAVLAACGLFAMKDQVRRLEGELDRMQTEIRDERIAISRLKTEWAMLNQPGRIDRLATTHLGLKPAKPGQIVQITDIPLRSEIELGNRPLSVVLPSGEEGLLRLKPSARLLLHPGLRDRVRTSESP
ncbi:MAG: cell division protein FtsL [Pseudomonadota bacterium]